MNEEQQILYMQTRLIRMAAEKWNISMDKAARIFSQYDALNYIAECFDIFHVQGDEENLADIEQYIRRNEVSTKDGSNERFNS